MTGTAAVLAAAMLIVFAGACVAAAMVLWLDDRRWRREFEADEPPSRFDRMDGVGDEWQP